jgi:two-component system OmpR family response regulator
MLPETDGFSILRSVRESFSLPVIMLTACNSKKERVKGLDQGADDYIGKPFHLSELLARIRAVLRRSQAKKALGDESLESGETLQTGPVSLEVSRQCLIVRQRGSLSKRNLSSLEFRLFYLFMSRAGETLSRDFILEHLFEDKNRAESHSLNVYISRLRRVLSELGADSRTLTTVWGSGYLWKLE